MRRKAPVALGAGTASPLWGPLEPVPFWVRRTHVKPLQHGGALVHARVGLRLPVLVLLRQVGLRFLQLLHDDANEAAAGKRGGRRGSRRRACRGGRRLAHRFSTVIAEMMVKEIKYTTAGTNSGCGSVHSSSIPT